MRQLRKNTTALKYALYSDKQPIYELDEYGYTVYDEIDGEEVPRIIDYREGYGDPVPFYGNIAFSGGESEAEVYGVSIDAYDSKLVMPKDAIPIAETSLIFKESEPEYDSKGFLKKSSADFRVVKIAKSLNDVVYLLKRIVHNG